MTLPPYPSRYWCLASQMCTGYHSCSELNSSESVPQQTMALQHDTKPEKAVPVFGVVGAVIERDGKFLLVQEGVSKSDCGKWNQPAGWISIGENAIQAVIREVKEETGLNFDPTGLIGVYSLYRRSRSGNQISKPHVLKFIFKGDITGGEAILFSEEISCIQWFTIDEIRGMNSKSLRDPDIIIEINDYLAGKSFPLDIIKHTTVHTDSRA